MRAIDVINKQLRVDINREELLIINAALNEVCNGIAMFEFETRIGATPDRVAALLKEVGTLIDKTDFSGS